MLRYNKSTSLERGAHHVHAPLINASETFDPAHQSRSLPAFKDGRLALLFQCGRWLRTHEKFRNHRLHEPGGLLGAGFGDAEKTLDESRLSSYPSKAAAWCNSFAESVKADDAAVCVNVEVRRYKAVQKGVATAVFEVVGSWRWGRRGVACT